MNRKIILSAPVMAKKVLFSLCIPAFKRTDFLKRSLDSIAGQTFRDFEVIVTDDSPDDSVKQLCAQYQSSLPLQYVRNANALGTPENWNEAIRRAKGEWIKLVHDDDWLSSEKSLQSFANAIASNPAADFFFCAYRNIYLENNREKEMYVNSFRLKKLLKNSATLFSENVVGPPSVVLHRNDKQLFYDNRTKWVVDIDFYIRYFARVKPVYIPEVLINVGVGSHQVTQECFRRRIVEIPENFYLLSKTGTRIFKDLLVYDAWWRMMRNLEVVKAAEIREAGYTGPVHPVILSMVRWQSKIPRSLLTNGLISKTVMFVHYILHRNQIN